MTQMFAHAAALEAALREIVSDLPPVTLTLDYGATAPEGPLAITATIDRSTRTLIFARAEATTPDGALAISASAVFRRPEADA